MLHWHPPSLQWILPQSSSRILLQYHSWWEQYQYMHYLILFQYISLIFNVYYWLFSVRKTGLGVTPSDRHNKGSWATVEDNVTFGGAMWFVNHNIDYHQPSKVISIMSTFMSANEQILFCIVDVFVSKFFFIKSTSVQSDYLWWGTASLVFALSRSKATHFDLVHVLLPDLFRLPPKVSSDRRACIWEGSWNKESPWRSSDNLMLLPGACTA